MRLLAPILALLFLLPQAPVAAQSLGVPAAQEDGPHVLWEDGRAKVLRLHQGRLEETVLPPPYRLDLPGLPPLRLDPKPPRPPRAVFPRARALAAVSDVHGNAPGLVALLQAQGILDRNRAWAFGTGHLVVVGDMLDRGAQVTEVLWLLRSLEGQARAAGGGVHVLLGNHEAMVLKGDLRYTHPRYRALPLPRILGTASEEGRWLRSLPALVKVGDVLFVHGGLTAPLAAAHPDIEALDADLRGELAGTAGPLLGDGGPLWYRGLIPGAGSEAPEADITRILRTYGARILVVGHTTLDQITAFHGGRVFGIDAGLKDGRPGELWLWIGAKAYRGLADGSRVALEGPSR